jgi:hypothetical protein
MRLKVVDSSSAKRNTETFNPRPPKTVSETDGRGKTSQNLPYDDSNINLKG